MLGTRYSQTKWLTFHSNTASSQRRLSAIQDYNSVTKLVNNVTKLTLAGEGVGTMGRADVILDLFATVFAVSSLIYLFSSTIEVTFSSTFVNVSYFTYFLFYSRGKFVPFLVYLTSGKHFSGMQMSPSRVERFAPSNLSVIYSRIRLDVLRKGHLIVKLYVQRRGCDKL